MAEFTWELQGETDTTIADKDKLQFAAGTFDSKIKVDEYNDSTHVKADDDSDKSSGNSPVNNKYVSETEVSVDGGTAKALDTITDSECALKVNFAHGSDVEVENAIFYAYDGTSTTDAPDGITFQAAESGDDTWTNAEGSASALALDDKTTAGQLHDYFIGASARPTSVGEKTGKMRMELTYF